MKKRIAIALGLGLACAAQAGISIHGSTTAFQETGGDWLTMGANDIDSSGGLGTDGYYFAGAETSPGVFNGVQNNNSGDFAAVGVQASYITAFAGSASVVGTAYGNSAFGVLDDALLLDGTDAYGGFWIGTGGSAGDTLENVTFTVGPLAAGQTVRVGVMSGLNQDTDGRWEPTSITLSDGISIATVGDHITSPLPTDPGGIQANGGWVFFDIDAAGDYTLSGTKRLSTQGLGFSGVTFDSIPEPATLGLIAAFGGGILFIRRRFMM